MTRRPSVCDQACLRLTLVLAVMCATVSCSSLMGREPPLARKRSWEVSFNQGHASAVAALYAPDAQLVISGEARVRGRAAIRNAIDRMLHSGVKVRIGTDRAAAAGDLAYFYGSYEISSGEKVVERGTYLEVWHRYGTQWCIKYDVNAVGAPILPAPGH